MFSLPADYNVQLQMFEGPLDLLLHLIKKDDLNIYDIPVSHILDQYLGYLELMQELDIDVAGEFILMASTLSHIKSRMLVQQSIAEEEEEGPDPRAELIARLMELQKYKLASQWLWQQPVLGRDVFTRGMVEVPTTPDPEQETLSVEPYKLLEAFKIILDRAPKDAIHQVTAERISITDRIYQIVDRLTGFESLLFTELFEGMGERHQMVITFLAILEMGRLKMLHIYQLDPLGPIRVAKRMEVIDGQKPIETDS